MSMTNIYAPAYVLNYCSHCHRVTDHETMLEDSWPTCHGHATNHMKVLQCHICGTQEELRWFTMNYETMKGSPCAEDED